MLCYELGQQIITESWSIEKTKTFRANCVGLPR